MEQFPKPKESFMLSHKFVDGAHLLTITPNTATEEFGAVTIRIGEAEANGLQQAFIQMTSSDEPGILRLCYI